MKKHSVLAAGFAGILFFGISFLTLGAVLPSLRDTLHLDVKQMSLLAGVLPLGFCPVLLFSVPGATGLVSKFLFLQRLLLLYLVFGFVLFSVFISSFRLCIPYRHGRRYIKRSVQCPGNRYI